MEFRNCPDCGPQPVAAFGQAMKRGKLTFQTRCRECHRIWNRSWHAANAETIRPRLARNREASRSRARNHVLAWLQDHPCVDCGENDPVVRQFDHRDGEQKKLELSHAVGRGWSVTRIQQEIDKCDVRCANCHLRRTAKQFGWWRYSVAADSAVGPPKPGCSVRL